MLFYQVEHQNVSSLSHLTQDNIYKYRIVPLLRSSNCEFSSIVYIDLLVFIFIGIIIMLARNFAWKICCYESLRLIEFCKNIMDITTSILGSHFGKNLPALKYWRKSFFVLNVFAICFHLIIVAKQLFKIEHAFLGNIKENCFGIQWFPVWDIIWALILDMSV